MRQRLVLSREVRKPRVIHAEPSRADQIRKWRETVTAFFKSVARSLVEGLCSEGTAQHDGGNIKVIATADTSVGMLTSLTIRKPEKETVVQLIVHNVTATVGHIIQSCVEQWMRLVQKGDAKALELTSAMQFAL